MRGSDGNCYDFVRKMLITGATLTLAACSARSQLPQSWSTSSQPLQSRANGRMRIRRPDFKTAEGFESTQQCPSPGETLALQLASAPHA